MNQGYQYGVNARKVFPYDRRYRRRAAVWMVNIAKRHRVTPEFVRATIREVRDAIERDPGSKDMKRILQVLEKAETK